MFPVVFYGFPFNKLLECFFYPCKFSIVIYSFQHDPQFFTDVVIVELDRSTTFVFISNDIGLEVLHNRIITLPIIGNDLKIDVDDYDYDGFAGPLYIVLPESYNGPKEKMIMKSFKGYAGWNISMLSDKYVLYEARMKR